MTRQPIILNPGSSAFIFEEAYLRLRRREGRLYTDEEVKQLPRVRKDHPYAAEWKARAHSSEKLFRYLLKKKQPLRILEAGCGNGWLTHRLSHLPHSYVAGMDINREELNQATRVFHHCNRLGFIYGDLRRVRWTGFDVIVFAASIQYFPSLKEIIDAALQHLNPGGEIHVLDTHFYSKEELPGAISRSAGYFIASGAEEMQSYYFHHSLSDLEDYNFRVMYDPGQWFHHLRSKNPFYWIRILPT